MSRSLIVWITCVVLLAFSTGLLLAWRRAASDSNRSMLDYASGRWTTLRNGDLLERESRKMAGPAAVDCGRAPLGGPLRVNDCVLSAMREKRPFRARFIVLGIDAHIERALIEAADGSAYEITFMEGPYVPAEYTLYEKQCPEPLKLELTDQGSVEGGRLTCFPNLAK